MNSECGRVVLYRIHLLVARDQARFRAGLEQWLELENIDLDVVI